MVDQVPSTPEPRRELGSHEIACGDLARRWAATIASTLLSDFERPKLEALLAGYLDQLDDGRARQVGQELVGHGFINSATLEKSIKFLHQTMELDSTVLGALAAGYSDGLRNHTLDQQELSKTVAISTTRKAEEALRSSEAKFRAIFRTSALAIAVTGLDGVILDYNEALLQLLDYTAEELRGLTVRELVHPEDRAAMREAAEQLALSGAEHVRVEKRMVRSDGETLVTLMAVALVREPDGSPAYHVTMIESMNEVRALQTQLVRQSLNDVQTGLPNRAQYLGWLEGAVGTKGPDALALVHFDIDGFRVVNNAFGHDAGNRILLSVANHLRAVFGEVGQLARIGPDEFGVLIKDPTDVRGVVSLVEDVTDRLTEPIYIDDNGVAVTFSVGIVVRGARGGDASELLRAADVTVGWAKSDGKAQWALYDRERDMRGREQFALAASIPGALEEGQFHLEYVPVRSFEDQSLLALEAKLCWDHPTLGVLCPEQFLGLATETGMIVRLVRWAMGHACEQAGEWYAELGAAAPVLSMDLPPRTCQEPELVAEVLQVLQRTGLPAELLRFELHEHLPALLNEEQMEELSILAERGVQLVLDQLGGGNVGVDKLRQLPLKGVKFTGAVVHSLDDGANRVEESASIALLQWSRLLPMQRLAEDVRTETEVRRLTELGVTGGQGPYFGPPLTAAEAHALILSEGQG